MKPLTKALLASGIIDKTVVAMLEKWGSLDPGSSDYSKVEITRTELWSLVEQLEEIINRTDDVKETRLEILTKKPPLNLYNQENGIIWAVEDEMHRFIVAPNIKLNAGDCLWLLSDKDGRPVYRVITITYLWKGLELMAKQLDVEPLVPEI